MDIGLVVAIGVMILVVEVTAEPGAVAVQAGIEAEQVEQKVGSTDLPGRVNMLAVGLVGIEVGMSFHKLVCRLAHHRAQSQAPAG